ncbi:hypothetical protein BOFE_10390 (plasmid) [Candidatus Borrelia fainii]|uniref:Uncharacterized protein n=1 Tax=Candidatus Borrelia fainii TaxID=2518322 RepID=A0ABN6USY5_9SPIR|nr:hypothetical protein BOFE_10390 [Candidatus Borrelia fainii]
MTNKILKNNNQSFKINDISPNVSFKALLLSLSISKISYKTYLQKSGLQSKINVKLRTNSYILTKKPKNILSIKQLTYKIYKFIIKLKILHKN